MVANVDQKLDVMETDYELRKNTTCEPTSKMKFNFALEFGFQLTKTERDAEAGMNVLYHVMPLDFVNHKITGAIIYEDTHSNQLELNIFNSSTSSTDESIQLYYP